MIKLYRVWCKYEKDHINPLTARKGQWRVFSRSSVPIEPNDYDISTYKGMGVLSIPSTHLHARGTIIRPHKELNRVFAARRTDRIVQAVIDEGAEATRRAAKVFMADALPALFPPTVNVSQGGGIDIMTESPPCALFAPADWRRTDVQ